MEGVLVCSSGCDEIEEARLGLLVESLTVPSLPYLSPSRLCLLRGLPTGRAKPKKDVSIPLLSYIYNHDVPAASFSVLKSEIYC